MTNFALPNVNVPLYDDSGRMTPAWYLFFSRIKAAVTPDSAGVDEVIVGDGLGTDVAGGTITSTGTIFLNLDFFGDTEGTILFRGPSAWEGLGPGGEGTFLSANGNAAPSWAEPTEIVPDVAPGDVLGNTTNVSAPAQSISLSSLLDVAVGNTQGMILFRSFADWIALAPGQATQVLSSGGSGYDVYWADAGPTPVARGLATPVVIDGVKQNSGISADGSQNFMISTGLGS